MLDGLMVVVILKPITQTIKQTLSFLSTYNFSFPATKQDHPSMYFPVFPSLHFPSILFLSISISSAQLRVSPYSLSPPQNPVPSSCSSLLTYEPILASKTSSFTKLLSILIFLQFILPHSHSSILPSKKFYPS